MSTCGSSLRHIFENTISENSKPSSLIESLSSPWKQIRPIKPPLDHSFTEIFGELHFKESSDSTYSSPSPWKPPSNNQGSSYHKRNDSFSSLNSESLQLCTEGLGSESLDYVEELKIELPGTWLNHGKNDDDTNDNSNKDDNYLFRSINSCRMGEKVNYRAYRQSRQNGKTFPPPISCIGKTGKPGVSFQSYRQDGRFVLEEIRIPTYERLHASREDGHLRLSFIQPSDQDDNDEDKEGAGGEGQGCVDNVNKDEGEETEGETEKKEKTEATDDIERGHS